jgi:hypothetical protein
MGKGAFLGQQYLEEGEYTINGGLGNKTLKELKVVDGVILTKNELGEWSNPNFPNCEPLAPEPKNIIVHEYRPIPLGVKLTIIIGGLAVGIGIALLDIFIGK